MRERQVFAMKIKKIFLLFLTVSLALGIAGCSLNGGLSVEGYVNRINSDMHDIVNITRSLREVQENSDTRSPDDTNDYIELLGKLEDLYSDLLMLEAPNRYDDIDDDIKLHAKTALADISELKSLITVSQTTGDDAIYKRELPNIMEEYDNAYNELSDLSAQAQTRFRND